MYHPSSLLTEFSLVLALRSLCGIIPSFIRLIGILGLSVTWRSIQDSFVFALSCRILTLVGIMFSYLCWYNWLRMP